MGSPMGNPMHVQTPNYPAMRLICRHGRALAMVLGLLVAVTSIALAARGGGALAALGGVVGGALVWLLLQSYVEMAQIISDMLLPK